MNTCYPLRRLLVFGLLLVLFAVVVGFPNVPESAFSQNPSQSQLIESDDPLVLRHGDWQMQSAVSASSGAYLYNVVPASSTFDTAPANVPALMLNFTGPSIEILYTTGPSLGILAVEVDDVVLRTIITTADTTHYQQHVVMDYLTDEPHTLRVYPAQGTIAIDAFIAPLPPTEPDSIAAAANCPPLDTAQLLAYNAAGTLVPRFRASVSFSADGRYVAFTAIENGFVPDDADGFQDVFVRDLHTCTNELISVPPPGISGLRDAGAPVITPDGRYVAFIWRSDTNQIFVRDRQTQVTTVATIGIDGAWSNRGVYHVDISADGRFIAFASDSDNLVSGYTTLCPPQSPGIPSNCLSVYLQDLQTGVRSLITRTPSGAQTLGITYFNNLFLSGDGNWVLYDSNSTDLVAGDTNGQGDVFLYNRIANQTTRISVANDGTQANGSSSATAISSDARTILFNTNATNLDANNRSGTFVYDRVVNQLRRISVPSIGNQAIPSLGMPIHLSLDGRYIAFDSNYNWAISDPGYYDVYSHDLQSGQTSWVSGAAGGVSINADARMLGMSGDARWVAFRTTARLHPDDTNDVEDTYIVPATGFTFEPPPPLDRLAVFNAETNMLSRIDSMASVPPPSSFITYPAGLTTTGQWVMGDWDGDGHDSPGQFRQGAMIYTNDLTTTSNWTGIWLGPNGYPVAGRFDATVNHDCVGVIDSFAFPPYGTGFALYYTCDLTSGPLAPISSQWLSVLFPDSGGFTGTFQFTAGDFNADGVDSITVRRGRYIAWTDNPPTTLAAAFYGSQYFRPIATDIPEGYLVAGDWDFDGQDRFGLYYPDGHFYFKTNLLWNQGVYYHLQISLPVGTPTTAASWR